MKFILNGIEMQMDEGKDQLEYDTIAHMADLDPAWTPTITYATGRIGGTIVRGERVLVRDGMVINCLITGSA